MWFATKLSTITHTVSQDGFLYGDFSAIPLRHLDE